MRKASNDYSLITDGDKFIGVSLGYDFTAEHEWGIEDMKRKFGMPEPSKKNMGVKNRTITKCPDSLILKNEVNGKDKYAVLFTAYKDWNGKINEELPHDLAGYMESIKWNEKWAKEHPNSENKDPMITAWDSGSFGVAVKGVKECEYLQELFQAFQDKNVVIARLNIGGDNPFSNASLSLLIADRLPQYALDGFMHADKEYYDREDYEEKIGMKKIIEKYGNKNGYKGEKYFMACSPKWIDYDDKERREEIKKKNNTKYNIQYWVNYSDNDENYGWYTVEEIKKWLTTPELHLKTIRGK